MFDKETTFRFSIKNVWDDSEVGWLAEPNGALPAYFAEKAEKQSARVGCSLAEPTETAAGNGSAQWQRAMAAAVSPIQCVFWSYPIMRGWHVANPTIQQTKPTQPNHRPLTLLGVTAKILYLYIASIAFGRYSQDCLSTYSLHSCWALEPRSFIYI